MVRWTEGWMPKRTCLLCLRIKLLVKTPLLKKPLDESPAITFFNNSTKGSYNPSCCPSPLPIPKGFPVATLP